MPEGLLAGGVPAALFFYGVLRPDLASGRMAQLVALLGAGEPASVPGALYAVPDSQGHYPVMVAGSGLVHGTLLRPGAGFGPAELAELDRFEGADYRRGPVSALTAAGASLGAEAYLWGRPLTPSLIPIPHGDFARYLRETGASPLPG